MADNLNKNILATIIYYDGLNYPLTAFEVWKYLIRTDYSSGISDSSPATLFQITKKIQEPILSKYVDHFNGFYFLKGRKDSVNERIAKNKISAGKIKKLRRIVWWLRLVPFVRMVGITGALAMKNARASSDLDLFIVLKYGKIWTGRTVVTGILHLFGIRRHGKKIANRVCLNFFVTDQSLEVITKDLFSASEYMFLFPIYGFEPYLKFQIKNRWIQNMKPSYALAEIQPLVTISDSNVARKIRTFGEMLLSSSHLETWLRKIEKKRIMKNPMTHREGSMVYANDDALVFLPNPHGPNVFEAFKEKIKELNL